MKNPGALIGWGLAVLAVALGYTFYGWPGVLMALSAVVFWLLLQFSRAMQAMRAATQAPVGMVASAVMLQSRLKPGMRLMDLLKLTRSLGHKQADEPETYRWTDPAGHWVQVELAHGKLARWTFERAPDGGADAMPASAGAAPAGTGPTPPAA